MTTTGGGGDDNKGSVCVDFTGDSRARIEGRRLPYAGSAYSRALVSIQVAERAY